jgi:hypothetical protein
LKRETVVFVVFVVVSATVVRADCGVDIDVDEDVDDVDVDAAIDGQFHFSALPVMILSCIGGDA